MLITRKSLLSGKTNTLYLDITQEQIKKYDSGEGKIQEIFGNLTTAEREFFHTGITADEWFDTFGIDE